MELASKIQLWLRPGTEPELLEVMRSSREVWGAGISLAEYAEYHRLIRTHQWSKDNFKHLVLVNDKNEILSSCKVYFHTLWIDSELFKLCGIGAVFTPKPYRGKGYATQMLKALLDELTASKVDLALLFSDISSEFYEQFGFGLIPKKDPTYIFNYKAFKNMSTSIKFYRHLPMALLDWHRQYVQRRKFFLERGQSYFDLLSQRIDWHRTYLGFKEQVVIVSEESKSYLWIDRGESYIQIRDFASADSDPERALNLLLNELYNKFPFSGITGWLPKEFEHYKFLRVKEKRARTKTMMMFCALNQKANKIFELSPEEIQFWLADYF